MENQNLIKLGKHQVIISKEEYEEYLELRDNYPERKTFGIIGVDIYQVRDRFYLYDKYIPVQMHGYLEFESSSTDSQFQELSAYVDKINDSAFKLLDELNSERIKLEAIHKKVKQETRLWNLIKLWWKNLSLWPTH